MKTGSNLSVEMADSVICCPRQLLTLIAKPEQGQRVTFNEKIGLLTDLFELFTGDTYVDIHHPVALDAGEVMVVVISTGTVGMAPVWKIDAVEQARTHQHFNRAENSRATDMRV